MIKHIQSYHEMPFIVVFLEDEYLPIFLEYLLENNIQKVMSNLQDSTCTELSTGNVTK